MLKHETRTVCVSTYTLRVLFAKQSSVLCKELVFVELPARLQAEEREKLLADICRVSLFEERVVGMDG